MSLFDFIKNLLGTKDSPDQPSEEEQRAAAASRPSSVEDRDLSAESLGANAESPTSPSDTESTTPAVNLPDTGNRVPLRQSENQPVVTEQLSAARSTRQQRNQQAYSTGSSATGSTGGDSDSGSGDGGSGSTAPQSSSVEGLNTQKFAPISQSEALGMAGGVRWKTAYLDSMSVIPPADVPRIQVIDRTMVGLGLISAEELVEIHEVGEDYEIYRTDYQVIAAAGQQAVQQHRQERERIKAEKKKEAAAKREARARAIKKRKGTDIVYLGRGVSKNLVDRKSHVEKLQAAGLPVLATPGELAKAMEMRVSQLRWLAFHELSPKQIHYVNFTIPKKSGGVRRLSAPHRKLAAAQQWVLENVLSKVPIHAAAHGFAPGRSIVTNAKPHEGSDVVVNVDLKDFFPSISFHRAEGMFRSLGYSGAVATIIALLCTECPRQTVEYQGIKYHTAIGPRGLPQGACTSPAISNLISRHLDLRLAGMAKKLDWTYTRYADDISFSASGEAAGKVGYVLARIRHIADDEGFAVNEKKTRVLRRHTQQSVTGVVVNDVASLSRKKIRNLRAILHNAKKGGANLAAIQAQNRDNRDDFVAWLAGMISVVEMVHAEKGGRLRRDFDAMIGS